MKQTLFVLLLLLFNALTSAAQEYISPTQAVETGKAPGPKIKPDTRYNAGVIDPDLEK